MSHGATITLLSVLFGIEFVALAIAPADRQTWLLENTLVVVFGIGLWRTYKHFRFSRLSYVLIYLFLAVHEVGCHYTYSLVPYDEWWQSLVGFSLNEAMGFERNHYDRLIHLLYGLLLAYPIREVFLRIVVVRGFWSYFLPLDLTMSTSMIYELIEWGAAELFGGELGHHYVGSQGDVWDAHRDMALASLGALVAMVVNYLVDRRTQRHFDRDWDESLSVREPDPPDDPDLSAG